MSLPTHLPSDERRWQAPLRVAFRFVVCFFAITTLYLAIGHLSTVLLFRDPLEELPASRALFAAYQWGTARLFGSGIVYASTFGYVAYLTTAMVGAGAASIVWSLIDRRRLSYDRAHAVLRVYLRYLLAAVALSYGAVKVIPVQFQPPSLVALITPLGHITRMRLLWHSMGASTGYIVFTGLVEVIGGLLLLSRRTTALGAALLAAAFANVTVLNLGYEVGVQLNSTIYTLMAIVLLAPDARRLWCAFVARGEGPIARSPWTRRLAFLTKAVIVVLLITVNFRAAYVAKRDAVLPLLYGIYDVVEFARDGAALPAGDQTRWLRFVVAERGAAAIQWTMGGRVEVFTAVEDAANGVLTLTARGANAKVLTFRYTRRSDGGLDLTGRVEAHDIQARLQPIDLATFPLRRPRR